MSIVLKSLAFYDQTFAWGAATAAYQIEGAVSAAWYKQVIEANVVVDPKDA